MYAIIEWAKRKGFKKILLEDASQIQCLNTKMPISYSLYYGYILQSGYPWYWKFGFRYEEEILNTKLEENKRKLDGLRVESLGFEDLVDMLIKKIELERYIDSCSSFSFRKTRTSALDSDMLDNKNMLRNIGKMSEVYKRHIFDENVYEFFREMYIECCEIMGLITLNLSRGLGIHEVRGPTIDEVKRMVLLL